VSKIGDWVLGMQEDALEMTREEFIQFHGEYNSHVWEYMNEAYAVEYDYE
jgi:hypothetical protein